MNLTVGELAVMTRGEFMNLPDIGPRRIAQAEAALAKSGLRFRLIDEGAHKRIDDIYGSLRNMPAVMLGYLLFNDEIEPGGFILDFIEQISRFASVHDLCQEPVTVLGTIAMDEGMIVDGKWVEELVGILDPDDIARIAAFIERGGLSFARA